MAWNWSDIITTVAGLGASVLALFQRQKCGTQTSDAVSSAYLQGGFLVGTSPGATMKVNPIIWILLIGGALLMFFGLRRRR